MFGTLYPAYSSYKAVKSKDVREYVSISFVFLVMKWYQGVSSSLIWIYKVQLLELSFTVLSHLGKMDDVLDNIRPVHDCGSIYRYVSLLVSGLRYLMLIIIQKTLDCCKTFCHWHVKRLCRYALLYQWLHHFASSLQASFLLWTEDSLCGVAAVPVHQRLQCAIQEVCSSHAFLKRKGENPSFVGSSFYSRWCGSRKGLGENSQSRL